jgi:hypothetical protein
MWKLRRAFPLFGVKVIIQWIAQWKSLQFVITFDYPMFYYEKAFAYNPSIVAIPVFLWSKRIVGPLDGHTRQ